MAERKSSKKKVVEKSVEASLWESANKLRGSVEPAEYNTLATLEQNAGALYRHTFVDNIDPNNLPQGWRMGMVGEVCSKLGSGAMPKGGKETYCQEGISLIRSTNVLDYRFLYEDLAKINETQAKALDGVTIESKDILFNITGVSVARCCMYGSR